MTGDIRDLIRRRRAQMLVHSHIYYRLSDSLISDHTFDRWAMELVELQELNADPIGFYDDVFANWTGDTGMHLPGDDWIHCKAELLLRYHEAKERPQAGDSRLTRSDQ